MSEEMEIICELTAYEKLIIDFDNKSFLLLGKEQIYGEKHDNN